MNMKRTMLSAVMALLGTAGTVSADGPTVLEQAELDRITGGSHIGFVIEFDRPLGMQALSIDLDHGGATPYTLTIQGQLVYPSPTGDGQRTVPNVFQNVGMPQ